MPKRTFDMPMDTTTGAGDKIQRVKVQKTERSHEENQERAYIAASRRADRSLEARVQSAKMASEIHRRRTGRALKVTEEIVLREEMYEEEEDDLPRQYKYLTAHLQTNSPVMNSRVNAYITTQAAMATMARYNEINKLFSESFPTATAYQQQMNQSMYMAPFMNSRSEGATGSSYQQTQPPPPLSPIQGSRWPQLDDLDSRRPSVADSLLSATSTSVSSPPALSPSSSTTPESRNTPYQTPVSAFPPPFQLDPQLAQRSSSSGSIFTSELPNEAKLMANIDMNDPMAMPFLGCDGNDDRSAWSMFNQVPGEGLESDETTTDDASLDGPVMTSQGGDIDPSALLFPPMDSLPNGFDMPPTESYSRVGTPGGGGGGDPWESFVDFGSEH